jgi:hypothetical protein
LSDICRLLQEEEKEGEDVSPQLYFLKEAVDDNNNVEEDVDDGFCI